MNTAITTRKSRREQQRTYNRTAVKDPTATANVVKQAQLLRQQIVQNAMNAAETMLGWKDVLNSETMFTDVRLAAFFKGLIVQSLGTQQHPKVVTVLKKLMRDIDAAQAKA